MISWETRKAEARNSTCSFREELDCLGRYRVDNVDRDVCSELCITEKATCTYLTLEELRKSRQGLESSVLLRLNLGRGFYSHNERMPI